MAKVLVHLTARTRPGYRRVCEPEHGSWLWNALRGAFPDALGCALMPDHLHLAPERCDPAAARRRLGSVLRHYSRRFSRDWRLWLTGEPAPIANVAMLRRTIRYIALNPPRAGYVTDPLEWIWSTHRDVMGTVVEPWTSAERLALALRDFRSNFADRHHIYVSSDPNVSVTGTPPPVAAPISQLPSADLSTIAHAAAAATRGRPAQIKKRSTTRTTFIQLAATQGWGDARLIATACDMTPRAVRLALTNERQDLHGPARLCLGDPRLRPKNTEPLTFPLGEGQPRPATGRQRASVLGKLKGAVRWAWGG